MFRQRVCPRLVEATLETPIVEAVLADDDADDVPDPFAPSVPTSPMFPSMVPPAVPRSQPSRSRIPIVPTLGASPRSVPSGLSPRLHRKHVRLRRLSDRPTNPVTKLRKCNRLHHLPRSLSPSTVGLPSPMPSPVPSPADSPSSVPSSVPSLGDSPSPMPSPVPSPGGSPSSVPRPTTSPSAEPSAEPSSAPSPVPSSDPFASDTDSSSDDSAQSTFSGCSYQRNGPRKKIAVK